MPPTLALLIPILLTLAGCDLLRQDPPDAPLEPGRRDYVWKVDTLNSPPGGFVHDIWGSSPDNVWAVLGGGVNSLWHFDGEKWEVWPVRVGPSFYSIFGFSHDDVWMGANGGNIYHFDGNQWSLAHKYEREGLNNAVIMSIWGSSSGNIYATGSITDSENDLFYGFLLHYSGNNWKELVIAESTVQFSRVRGDRDGIFISGTDFNSNPNRVYLFRYSNNQLIELYNASTIDVYLTSLNRIDKRNYFIIGKKVYRYQDDRFEEWLAPLNPEFGYQIYGRHEKDFFFRLHNGLEHYNGTSFENLLTFDNNLFSISNNALIFDNDVFFIVRDYNKGTNLIYRGILEN